MPEREGFHLKTRSVMKQLLEDAKWMVLADQSKKRMLFKFRVDVWRRADNLPEDRTKRSGQGTVRRDRLEYTNRLCKYARSHESATQRQYHDYFRSRVRRQ
jgi:hypothetical protein